MAEIHYLFPRHRPSQPPATVPERDPGARRGVRVVVSPASLAAMLVGETFALGRPSPRVRALLETFPKPTEGPRNRLTLGREPPLARTPMSEFAPVAVDLRAEAPPIPQAWRVRSVRLGVPVLFATDEEARNAIGADEADLVARQSGDAPSFAFRDLPALERATASIVSINRTPIEGWLRRGAQPPLRLVLRQREAFGSVVHAGASQASDLLALAVTLSLVASPSQHVAIGFDL